MNEPGVDLMKEPKLLKKDTEETTVRYISFMTDFRRYDLALFESKDQNKVFILDLQDNHYVSVAKDELKTPKFYAHRFHVNEYEAEEIHAFLKNELA